MCLLDDVVLGVQALYWEPLKEAATRPFLVAVAHEITCYLTMGSRRSRLIEILFFALVAKEVLIENA